MVSCLLVGALALLFNSERKPLMKGLYTWRTLAEAVAAILTAALVLLGGCALTPDAAQDLHDLVDEATVQGMSD